MLAVAAEKDWPAPSYPVLRRIIAALDRGLLTMAHHGPEAYRNDFELVLRRESAHPNDLWQADHTELDVMILNESASRPDRDHGGQRGSTSAPVTGGSPDRTRCRIP